MSLYNKNKKLWFKTTSLTIEEDELEFFKLKNKDNAELDELKDENKELKTKVLDFKYKIADIVD